GEGDVVRERAGKPQQAGARVGGDVRGQRHQRGAAEVGDVATAKGDVVCREAAGAHHAHPVAAVVGGVVGGVRNGPGAEEAFAHRGRRGGEVDAGIVAWSAEDAGG